MVLKVLLQQMIDAPVQHECVANSGPSDPWPAPPSRLATAGCGPVDNVVRDEDVCGLELHQGTEDAQIPPLFIRKIMSEDSLRCTGNHQSAELPPRLSIGIQ